VVDQSQQTGPSDQSEQSRLLVRRGLDRANPLSNSFRHCEKRGDAAMYVSRSGFVCFRY